MIDRRPTLPYYAVIFTSIRRDDDPDYASTNDLLIAQAESIEGYLGEESVRNEFGVTISYWKDLESIAQWKQRSDHLLAQQKGRDQWYDRYRVRVCKVERDYEFKRDGGHVS